MFSSCVGNPQVFLVLIRQAVHSTDRPPNITNLARAKLENTHILCWALVLQEFDFRVVHIKGVENLGADYLS